MEVLCAIRCAEQRGADFFREFVSQPLIACALVSIYFEYLLREKV